MLKLVIISGLLVVNSAFATIWITLGAPTQNKIGAIGASSGPIGTKTTMIFVDNKGIATIGAYVLGNRNQRLYNLLASPYQSIEELAQEFSNQINDGYPRRLTMVTSRFETASIKGKGCHKNNEFCGEYDDEHFAITGGGLISPEVIPSTKDLLSDPSVQSLPIECQMYLGLEAIFRAGGEEHKFNRIAFVVDDLTKEGDIKHFVFYRKGRNESVLMEQLRERYLAEGWDCF